MSNKIKNTQLIRVGYQYQDYICIKYLIDWYHDPEKYKYIYIEGGSEKLVKSLDDIIIVDNQNRYILIQVKFTKDSQRDDLKISFEWLLKINKKRGTSLLQKWAKDVIKYKNDDLLSTAMLRTNRQPDEIFSKCLSDKKIDIGLIPQKYLSLIEEQLKGHEQTKIFFENFVFEHTELEIDHLENELKDSLVPDHTNLEGWYRLLDRVGRWATRESEPHIDRKILIEDIEKVLKASISQPLDQSFVVPDGYSPPSQHFHLQMLERSKDIGCFVISGYPGIGKSTYLSYLVEDLLKTGSPVIRHHYYMAAHDLVDRISYPMVSKSLQIELYKLFPDLLDIDKVTNDLDQLSSSILAVSDHLAKSDQTLVVIIDGLDHVIREKRNVNNLSRLINILIPLKNKVCLIFGMQAIKDNLLPQKLTSDITIAECKLNLPPMDLNAISKYVESLWRNNKITINGKATDRKRQVLEISQALLLISDGYPLYILYSINTLISQNMLLNKYDIERLPSCLGGDINAYYDSLWASIAPSSKEILLLVSCADFAWPDRKSLMSCFKDSLQFVEAFSEIKHLIEQKSSGITPFHESILIFIRNKKEFQTEQKGLLERIKTWLNSSAPAYWSWGWKWIVEAKLGNVTPLIKGISRDWLIDAFCNGYPLQHIEHIIATAENIAFQNDMFTDLVRLRLIRARLVNGPEFQLQDYNEFLKYSLILSKDDYGLLWRADNIRSLDDMEVAVISTLYKNRAEPLNQLCFDEIMRRLYICSKFYELLENSKIVNLINAGVEILTSCNKPNTENILKFLSKLKDKTLYLRTILDKLIESGNGHIILDIPFSELPKNTENIFCDYFILERCKEKILISDRHELEVIKTRPVGIIALLLQERQVNTELLIKNKTPESYESATVDFFYDTFVYSLAKQLWKLFPVPIPSNVEVVDVKTFINKLISHIEYCAYILAKSSFENDQVNIFQVYETIAELNFQRYDGYNYDVTNVAQSFSQALIKISLDVYVLFSSVNRVKAVNHTNFTLLKNISWWNHLSWLEAMIVRGIDLSPKEISQTVIHDELLELRNKQTNTMDLANNALRICKIATQLELMEEAKKSLKMSAQYVMGYGWRKDLAITELYTSIEACSKNGVGDISGWLKRIAPFTNDISYFTEREINHIPPWYMDLLAKHYPERLVDEFDYHMANQNWVIVDYILTSFTEHLKLDSLTEHAVLKGITNRKSLLMLKKRSETMSGLIDIYNEQLRFIGGLPPLARFNANDSVENTEIIDIPFEEYPPARINALVEEITRRQIFTADKFFEQWIAYWTGKNFGNEIIDEFDKICDENQDVDYKIRGCLDQIFSLSYSIQGHNKAYKWAVRSILLNHHWDRWSGQKSEENLKKYAHIYSAKWRELLTDTINVDRINLVRPDWILVCPGQLVTYLLAAGQLTLASEITEIILKNIEGEIACLNISPLHWHEAPVQSEHIASKIILLYYKWPDRFVRLRLANEIAKLIDIDASFRSLYLEHLNNLCYEVDVTDFISILLLTEIHKFTLEELRANIKHPSILLDQILLKLGYFLQEKLESLEYYSEISTKEYINLNEFEKMKDGIMPFYFSNIEKLGKQLSYPLINHLATELSIIQERYPFLYFDHHGFCNERFSRESKKLCSLSTSAESVVLSAYLRTLAFAHYSLNAPYDEILAMSISAAPFGGVYSRILPSSEPSGWPHMVETEIETISEENLVNYLENILACEQIILQANGPVKTSNADIYCDLQSLVIYLENELVSSPKQLYDNITKKDGSVPEKIYPLSYQSHPSDLGRWEFDWLYRGLFIPNFVLGAHVLSEEIDSDSIKYCAGDVTNATWRYWTHNWFPAHYKNIGPPLGTYLTTSKQNFELLCRKTSKGSWYILGNLKILDKRSYGKNTPVTEVFAMKKIN